MGGGETTKRVGADSLLGLVVVVMMASKLNYWFTSNKIKTTNVPSTSSALKMSFKHIVVEF